jgi:hypothetical protein
VGDDEHWLQDTLEGMIATFGMIPMPRGGLSVHPCCAAEAKVSHFAEFSFHLRLQSRYFVFATEDWTMPPFILKKVTLFCCEHWDLSVNDVLRLPREGAFMTVKLRKK